MRHRDRRLFQDVFSLSPSELYLRIIPQLYEVPARQTENNVESRSFKDDLLWVLVVLPLTFVLLVLGLFCAYHYHSTVDTQPCQMIQQSRTNRAFWWLVASFRWLADDNQGQQGTPPFSLTQFNTELTAHFEKYNRKRSSPQRTRICSRTHETTRSVESWLDSASVDWSMAHYSATAPPSSQKNGTNKHHCHFVL